MPFFGQLLPDEPLGHSPPFPQGDGDKPDPVPEMAQAPGIPPTDVDQRHRCHTGRIQGWLRFRLVAKLNESRLSGGFSLYGPTGLERYQVSAISRVFSHFLTSCQKMTSRKLSASASVVSAIHGRTNKGSLARRASTLSSLSDQQGLGVKLELEVVRVHHVVVFNHREVYVLRLGLEED